MGSSSEPRASPEIGGASAGAVALAVLVMLAAAPAHASNAAAPRVPPSFLDATCMQVVRKAEDPVVHLRTGIPFEDTARTADELPDSRTLQYFALCRGPDAMQPMPPWIDIGDVQRAAALDPAVGSPTDAEILATAAPFRGPGHDGEDGSCIVPIIAADARIPITCEATREGVSWDTTGVPAGAYEVWGYTFEPVASLWTRRPGVVRVLEAQDEASAGPAVAWSWPLSQVTAGVSAGVTLTGCVSGSPGTTVAIEWATAADLERDADAAWMPLHEVEPGDGGELSIPFVPSPELLHQAVFVRAIATDPNGRTFIATTRAPIVWRSGCDAPEGGQVALVDACGVAEPARGDPAPASAAGCDEPDAPAPSEGDDPPEEPSADDAAPDASHGGAGCRTTGEPVSPIVLLLAVPRRRRRQSPTRRTRVRSCESSPRT